MTPMSSLPPSTMTAPPLGTDEALAMGSPIGRIVITANDHGLTGVLFGDDLPPASEHGGSALLQQTRAELDEYFAGRRQRFTVPLSQVGTPFQRKVWAGLLELPFGATISYGALARRIGNPNAVRAVGGANGRNLIGIIVPCHRVIAGDGGLGGYAGGEERKRWLLAHERRVRAGLTP